MQLKQWVMGAYSEVEYWRVWLRTHGAFWRKDYTLRLREDTALNEYAASLLPDDVGVEDIKVLDVGSGPLSGLGTTYKGKRLNVRAADPLAKAYQGICRQCGVSPPVPVELAFAEDLVVFFGKDEFDLVVCQNALDHAFDPWRALRQMLEVSRPGGHVMLWHFRNEAENEAYSGLHQWNLDASNDGCFMIWNRQTSLNVNQLLADKADVKLLNSPPQLVVVALSKRPGVSLFDANDAEQRLRELLTEISDVAISLGREGGFMRACFAAQTYGQYLARKLQKLGKRLLEPARKTH